MTSQREPDTSYHGTIYYDIICDPSEIDRTVWVPGVIPVDYVDHEDRPSKMTAQSRGENFPQIVRPQLFGNEDSENTSDSIRYYCGRLFSANDPGQKVQDISIEGSAVYANVELLELIISRSSAEPLAASKEASKRIGVLAVHLAIYVKNKDSRQNSENRVARFFYQLQRGAFYKKGQPLHETFEAFIEVDKRGVSNGLSFLGRGGRGTGESVYGTLLYSGSSAAELTDSEKESRIIQLANRAAKNRAENDSTRRAWMEERIRKWSSDWSALAVRNVTVFTTHMSQESPFRRFPYIYYSTFYSDAVLLSRMQYALIKNWESIAVDIVSARDMDIPSGLSEASDKLDDLTRAISSDVARYWIGEGHANTGNAITLLHDIQYVLKMHKRFKYVNEISSSLASVAENDARNLRNIRESKMVDSQRRIERAGLSITVSAFFLAMCIGSYQVLRPDLSGNAVLLYFAFILLSAMAGPTVSKIYSSRSDDSDQSD